MDAGAQARRLPMHLISVPQSLWSPNNVPDADLKTLVEWILARK
jgi:hypothetical protein